MDTAPVCTALMRRRKCFLYTSPESSPCFTASPAWSPLLPQAGPAGWETGSRGVSSLWKSPRVARATLRSAPKWVSRRPEGDLQSRVYIPFKVSQGGRQGAGATLIPPPLIPTHREVPDGSFKSQAQTHHPLTSCSHLRSLLGEEFTRQVIYPAEKSGHHHRPGAGLGPQWPPQCIYGVLHSSS